MSNNSFDEKLRLLPPDHARRELWLRGDLSYILQPDGQKRAHDFVMGYHERNLLSRQPVVCLSHRGMGKSFLGAVIGIERCLQHPGHIARFGAPSFKNAVEILAESLPKILEQCPSEIKYHAVEHKITFWNPRWRVPENKTSVLYKFGTNRESIEDQRGLRTHTLIADEVRDWDALDYAMSQVLYFQTARMRNPLVLMTSTLPRAVSHYFTESVIPEAIEENRFFEVNIEDNTDVSEEEKNELAKACGGRHTIAWRREAMNELVSDPTVLVVPEFQEHKADIVKEPPRPTHYFPFVCADFGFRDHTAVLFAYPDFERQKLVVADEVFQHYQATSEIVAQIRAKTETVFGRTPLIHRLRRFADCPAQQLYDLEHDHKMFFESVDKYDKAAALASLRTAFLQGKIIISPKCKNLIYQILSGSWNKRRTDFARTTVSADDAEDVAKLGHLDALAALIYLWRMTKDALRINPFPAEAFAASDTFCSPWDRKPGSGVEITREPLIVTRNYL